jgi:6-phosphogluconate dehydrogenase
MCVNSSFFKQFKANMEAEMKTGFIGLGRMGLNMVRRLRKSAYEVVAYDPDEKARKLALEGGAEIAESIASLVKLLKNPRIIWVMVPAGEITQQVIYELVGYLDENDVIIDGGNSYYKDTIKRYSKLQEKGVHLLDAGTSGGIWGLQEGYCLMVGGDREIFERAEPVFRLLAPEEGYMHIGPSGAGHFVKMVHNGIEYALLQSYGEGFEIIKSKKDFMVDLERLSHLWNRGSVIRSWLLELAENAFKKDPDLHSIRGYVEDSGEGRWTVKEAIEENTSAPVITLSLLERFRSRQEETFSAKVIAALRNEFGGHSVKKK